MQPQYLPFFALRALLVACVLAVVSLMYLPLPILLQLAQAHGFGATAAGVISVFGLAYASGFLVFGPLPDRLGRRRVMVCGLTELALVTALLLAGRVVQGLAAAVFALTACFLWSTPADPARSSAASLLVGYRQLGRLLADSQLRRVYAPVLQVQGISVLVVRELALRGFWCTCVNCLGQRDVCCPYRHQRAGFDRAGGRCRGSTATRPGRSLLHLRAVCLRQPGTVAGPTRLPVTGRRSAVRDVGHRRLGSSYRHSKGLPP